MKSKEATGRNILLVSLLASGMMLLSPVLAFADEVPAEQVVRTGAEMLLPNMLEFIPMLVAFLLLWAILGKLGWPAIAGALDKREATIKDNLEKAEAARVEGERMLAEHQAQLDEARVEAAQIIANAKEAGEAVKADITAKAQQESADMIAKARLAIEAEKKAAIAELQGSVANMSVSVAGRLIGQDLSDDEHLKLIERYVAEAGSLDAN